MTKRLWTPLQQYPINPQYLETLRAHEDLDSKVIEIWGNDHYQITARIYPDGFTHLSCKREDRLPLHDWRQLQQIKNEICGPERWGLEVYPAESCIVDTSNEYHLWVLPEGHTVPWGWTDSQLKTPEAIERFNRENPIIDRFGEQRSGKARQRPWQPGLTTGLGADARRLVRQLLDDASLVDDPDGYYGYLVSPDLIRELREAVPDAGDA